MFQVYTHTSLVVRAPPERVAVHVHVIKGDGLALGGKLGLVGRDALLKTATAASGVSVDATECSSESFLDVGHWIESVVGSLPNTCTISAEFWNPWSPSGQPPEQFW